MSCPYSEVLSRSLGSTGSSMRSNAATAKVGVPLTLNPFADTVWDRAGWFGSVAIVGLLPGSPMCSRLAWCRAGVVPMSWYCVFCS
jgi:hypothetical protein